MSESTDLRAIECAGRAANRAAVILHCELARGIASLKAIACIAPLIGAFATAMGLINALALFPMTAFERGETSGSLGEAFILIALSLPVAILACGGFHYLGCLVETFDSEMRVTTLDLLNSLARLHRRRG